MERPWFKDPKTMVLTGLSAATGAVLGWTLITAPTTSAPPDPAPKAVAEVPDCSFRVDRIGSFRYTRPLYQAEQDCEAARFLPLKNTLSERIAETVKSGGVGRASIYLRALNNGQWMVVNNGASYPYGDLSRLPVMIAWTKAIQETPDSARANMIAHLANAADPADTTVIARMAARLSPEQWKDAFNEIGLQAPADRYHGESTPHDLAGFLKLVFNGNWLGPEDSDRLLEALDRNRATSLMGTELRENVPVCALHHERTDAGVTSLHEAGIVLDDNGPYLLVIMTEGSDATALRRLISEILRTVDGVMKGERTDVLDRSIPIG